MTKTLHALFDERGVADGGIDALREMSIDDARATIENYVARYINERLLQVIGDGLESLPADEIVLREEEIWDYVRNTVRLDLRDVDVLTLDWAGSEARGLTDRIFSEAHRLLQR